MLRSKRDVIILYSVQFYSIRRFVKNSVNPGLRFRDHVRLDGFYVTCRNPCTGLHRRRGFHEVEVPRFQDIRHMEVVRLSALSAGSLYP